MSDIKKICVVTGTRAEYGLLSGLMKEIDSSIDLGLQLVVTGMHLSPEFGLTYEEIEGDGFVIARKIEMLLSSDTEIGVGKSIGLGICSFVEVFADLKPDIVILLGDRFEAFAAASAATVAKIPLVHLHGGETTEGAFDEAFRHSITKMSHLHFTSTKLYRQRVIQLGESPSSVFNVGAIGIDNISKMKLLSQDDFEESIGFNLGNHNLLVTFHPVTLEKSTAEKQFGDLLSVLDELNDTHLIFTKANADTGGRVINGMIDDYVLSHADKSIAFSSLGRLRYFSAMQYIDGVIGNSSSGIIEVPSFKIGTVDIGDRQKGRIRAKSVINCAASYPDIKMAVKFLYQPSFQKMLQEVENPYGEGNVANKIVDIIRQFNFNNILKKTFYNIEHGYAEDVGDIGSGVI